MARVVAEGVPHHITQRGNNRQDTFLQDEDRRCYLNFLRVQGEQHGLSVLGYCLMTNHVHLVATPRQSGSLAIALGRAHQAYSRYFNRRYQRSGHLWQNRFYSCPLGRGHLATALLYVDLNPVRARLVGAAEHYPWSSAAAHLGRTDSRALLDDWAWNDLGLGADWKECLAAAANPAEEVELRTATYGGRPFGDETFVSEMEQLAGRNLRRQTPGPKPRLRAQAAGSA